MRPHRLVGYAKYGLLTLCCALLPALTFGAGVAVKSPMLGRVPWERPVPKANCGPSDSPETGLQGQTSLEERANGLAEHGFNCNLDLVGQFQGEGAGYGFAYFDQCAYYSTYSPPGLPSMQQHRGVVVLDASNPRRPVPTAYLDSPTMLDPHESLKVNPARKLLAGVERNGPGFAIYDISGDCRQPVLKASVVLPDGRGHAGGFTPDGLTYYGTNISVSIYAIDVTDPSSPTEILNWIPTFRIGVPHDIFFSDDGTRMYVAQPGAPAVTPTLMNGLVIVDVSDIQFRRPNPQPRVVGALYWNDGGNAQLTLPVTIGGQPYLIFTDERGAGGGCTAVNKQAACAQGLSPHGFARLIDISHEGNPKLASKLMLEVSDPANCAKVLDDPDINSYSSHYCDVDDRRDAKIMACSWREGGLRVFDIRDPYRPREIAYYKPPGRRTAVIAGSRYYWDWMQQGPPGGDRTGDETASTVRFLKRPGGLELWFSSQDNAFQIVKFSDRLKAVEKDLFEELED